MDHRSAARRPRRIRPSDVRARRSRDAGSAGAGLMWRGFLDALHADGPASDRADKMALYGQFVGSWDLDVIEYRDDGTTRPRPGRWDFGWGRGGRAARGGGGAGAGAA